MKITPAHDFNDFEVGKRHELPQINIFSTEAKLDLKDNRISSMRRAARRTIFEATLAMTAWIASPRARRIVARLEEKGLVEKIEPQATSSRMATARTW